MRDKTNSSIRAKDFLHWDELGNQKHIDCYDDEVIIYGMGNTEYLDDEEFLTQSANENTRLVTLRNALKMSAEDAERQILKAQSALGFCRAFGVGLLAVMTVFCVKSLTGSLDGLDYALSATFTSLTLGSCAYAWSTNRKAESSLELNNALGEAYSQEEQKLSEQQKYDNNYEIMFR